VAGVHSFGAKEQNQENIPLSQLIRIIPDTHPSGCLRQFNYAPSIIIVAPLGGQWFGLALRAAPLWVLDTP